MSDFYMLMPQAIRQPLLEFFCQKGSLITPPYSPDLDPCDFLFLKLKTFLTGWRYRPDRLLVVSHTNTLPVYLNQCTMTHSGSGFIDRNYAFLVMGTTLKACNKEMCDYLHFEHSRSE